MFCFLLYLSHCSDDVTLYMWLVYSTIPIHQCYIKAGTIHVIALSLLIIGLVRVGR